MKELIETSQPEIISEPTIDEKLDLLLKGQTELYTRTGSSEKKIQALQNDVLQILDKWAEFVKGIDGRIDRRFEGMKQIASETQSGAGVSLLKPGDRPWWRELIDIVKDPEVRKVASEFGIGSPSSSDSISIPISMKDLERRWISNQWTRLQKKMESDIGQAVSSNIGEAFNKPHFALEDLHRVGSKPKPT